MRQLDNGSGVLLRIAALALVATTAYAQELPFEPRPSAPPVHLRLDPNLTALSLLPDNRLRLAESARDSYKKALVMRDVGIAMTVFGTAASIAAAVLFAICTGDDSCNGALVSGIALLAVGPASALTGIPLWAVGQTRASRAKKAMLSLSATGAGLARRS